MQIIKFAYSLILMKTLESRVKSQKVKGMYMQIYEHLSCLLSYTLSLGANLMLIHSKFLMVQYANYLKIVFMHIK